MRKIKINFAILVDIGGAGGSPPPMEKQELNRGIFIVLYAPALTPCLGNLLHCVLLIPS